MKRIDDLKQKRYEKLDEMKTIVEQVISENRSKDEDESKRYSKLEKEVETIDAQIKEFESLEEINKRTGAPVVKKEESKTDPFAVRFRDLVQESHRLGKTSSIFLEERANPIITSTDTGIIEKIVNPAGIDVMLSPGEAFLRNLGVTFFTGLTGNFTLPSMGESEAHFVNEAADGSTANMASASVTLAARRLTHSQAISSETLAQTNPGVYQTIVDNLVSGLWNKVVKDVFTQVKADAASQTFTKPVARVAHQFNLADALNMEASIGGLLMNKPAYVCNPTTKAYLKGTIALGTTAGAPIWNANELNGIPAYSVPQISTDEMYLASWDKVAVGTWDNISLIVDPFSLAASGQLKVTATMLVDSGVINKRGITFCTDCSTY